MSSQDSVLHLQLSSPTSRSPCEESNSHDYKDEIIERLSGLIASLSEYDSLETCVATVMQAHIDEIEMIVGAESAHQNFRRHGVANAERSVSSVGKDPFWESTEQTQNDELHIHKTTLAGDHESQVSTAKAVELAKAAEDLATQLSLSYSELQVRREESDHVHDLLITRTEKAAQRILLLEYIISEMEDDFEANQSELKFLRIQLQAIEAQYSQYVPKDQDQDLAQSIKNWKVDWETIDRRSKLARKKVDMSPTPLGDSQETADKSSVRRPVRIQTSQSIKILSPS